MPTYVELLEHLQEFCQIILGKSYNLPTPKNKCQVKNQLYLQEFRIFDLVKLKKMTHKLISLHRISFLLQVLFRPCLVRKIFRFRVL